MNDNSMYTELLKFKSNHIILEPPKINAEFMTRDQFHRLIKNATFIQNKSVHNLLDWINKNIDKIRNVPENHHEAINQAREHIPPEKLHILMNSFNPDANDDYVVSENDIPSTWKADIPDPEWITSIMESDIVQFQIRSMKENLCEVITYDMMKYLPYPLSHVVDIVELQKNPKRKYNL